MKSSPTRPASPKAAICQSLPSQPAMMGKRSGKPKRASACASCHGPNFSTPTDGNTPKIAGQHADYLLVALKSYKYDNRPASGRSNGIMASFAKQFSDAELKALAKYIGSLDGELKVKPENKFR